MFKHQHNSSIIILSTPSDDGQWWPKYVKTKLVITVIELIRLDGVLLCIYLLRGVRIQDNWYRDWLRAGRPRGRGSSPGRIKNFHFSMSSRLTVGSTQSPIQWVPGALSPEVKRSGHEADHSPSVSIEVKKMWIYTSTPPYDFMA
jgi:hypothetical protein